jgi:hypothetical protein
VIARQELMGVLDQHAGSSLTNSALQELADAILALDKPPTVPVTDTGTMFPELRPAPTVTLHRYSDTDAHPVAECSPSRCGGDPRGWKRAVDPNKP